MMTKALKPEAPAFGLLLVLPARAYRRSFPGDFAAAARIPTPTARRRLGDWGYKGARWIEEPAAVSLRCLGAQTDWWLRRHRRRKVRRRAARERLGAEGSRCPRRVALDKGCTYICGLPWVQLGWRERRRLRRATPFWWSFFVLFILVIGDSERYPGGPLKGGPGNPSIFDGESARYVSVSFRVLIV